MNFTQSHQQGLTLLESMLSISLGLLLLLGLFRIFQSTQLSYRVQQGITEIQENGSLALLILSDEIHEAGYAGCRQYNHIVLRDNHQALQKIPALAIYTVQDKQRLPKPIAHHYIAGSHVLEVSYMNPQSGDLIADMHTEKSMRVQEQQTWQQGSTLLIADCKRKNLLHLQALTKALGSPIWQVQSSTNLPRYQRGAQIGEFMHNYFFIRDSGRVNHTGKAIYSLYQLDNKGQVYELLAGISNMHLYPHGHKLIEVVLDVDSVGSVLKKSSTYLFDGQQIQSRDGKLHKQWRQFIALRQANS